MVPLSIIDVVIPKGEAAGGCGHQVIDVVLARFHDEDDDFLTDLEGYLELDLALFADFDFVLQWGWVGIGLQHDSPLGEDFGVGAFR
jgi:hypothetical protein